MEEQIIDPIPAERPQALKTLCVLTFIGCGLVFILSLLNLPQILKSNEQKLEEMEKLRGYSPAMADQLEAQLMDPSYKTKSLLKFGLDIILVGCSLAGAIMMWNLKKKGFYIYTVAEVLAYFTGFVMGNTNPMAMLSGFPAFMKNIVIVVFAVMIILDFLFIFLYWRQTKYMK